MSKAEERALKAYPKIIKRYRKLGDIKENTGSEYDENLEQRAIYIKGYRQAEKDLELTWEDIKLLIDIIDSESLKPHLFDEIDYQEVLERFKTQKGEKV